MYIVKKVNKYKYCERYRDPLTNKRKVISVTLEKKTKQAQHQAQLLLQAKIARIMSQVKHVDTIPGVTLQRLVDDYLANHKLRVRRSTINLR